ncbi:uncharacterized protein J4E88_008149 [Alternaria novae-zelandiae]|uniref:uncharacterized protein n=1 Tax=Alternaria novae-zelandiae TaxID=430562 RepID=UPI0020C46B7A|nr:uncharacterized protein J4E88_008149 [Alternaria novae-zelandiae]KAI4674415.1 hypothetical protein J4E88_008149 [Alternaria novae-zelandiae]
MVTTRAQVKAAHGEEPPQPFRLLDLPAEIIGDVSNHLAVEDLINVRRVCRALTAHSANAFGQRFFNNLVVILHPTSLATLLEICRHPVLSRYVHELTVSGERIGHGIALINGEEVHEKRHIDLQTSVERSRMDLMILTEVFREFNNLKSIQIDVESFRGPRYIADDDILLRCGRSSMFSLEHSEGKSWDKGDDNGYNRVYGMTLQAIEQAEVEEKIELNLEFWNSSSTGVTFEYFDNNSRYWRERLCKKLRYVSTTNDMDPAWIGQLLSLSFGITKLELSQNHTLLPLAREPAGTFFFPGLRHLNFTEVVICHEELVAFLHLHASILEDVVIQSVGLQHGTWHQPLHVLETMPSLRKLWLSMLLEQAPYRDSSTDTLDLNFETPGFLSVDVREDIELALSAMRAHPGTDPSNDDIDGPNGELYEYVVHYGRGWAALDGDIDFRNGQWELVDDSEVRRVIAELILGKAG